MNGQVDISTFMSYLKDHDLVIVSRTDYEQKIHWDAIKLEQLQNKLLTKDSLSISEIVKAHLLPVSTRQSVKNWIIRGVFHPKEVYTDSRGVIRVLATAIKRVRTLKNIV